MNILQIDFLLTNDNKQMQAVVTTLCFSLFMPNVIILTLVFEFVWWPELYKYWKFRPLFPSEVIISMLLQK